MLRQKTRICFFTSHGHTIIGTTHEGHLCTLVIWISLLEFQSNGVLHLPCCLV